MKTADLSGGQKQTLKGLVDSSAPNCAARKQYYELAEKVGLVGAISFLRSVDNANQATVDLLETWFNGLTN